jgi:hypothetical protein
MPAFTAELLAPGNSAHAVKVLTEMLEHCRVGQCATCPGLGELLIQATVQSAIDRCGEEAEKKDAQGILIPGPRLVEDLG